ncbi:transcriptional regulator [Desulfatiferula olefinivorans]
MQKERDHTIRQAMIDALAEGPKTIRDLSQSLGIMEKDVTAHLPFIEKTLKHSSRRLHTEPFRCLNCGFVFKDRKKYTRPGRCPQCRRGRIDHALFRVE